MADEMNMFTEALRDEIVRTAESLADEKENEAKALRSIASDARYAQLKKLRNKVAVYAGEAELNFLEGKVLSVLVEAGEKPSPYDLEKMGTADAFPCTLTFDGDVWEFYLPPTPSVKNGNMARHVGRWSGYLAQNLISTYEAECGNIEMLKRPVIVFEIGIKGNTPLAKLYDADNRDNKRIIDAMTEHLIRDDNVLAIDTMYFGISTEESYTRVYVMERDFFPEWYRAKMQR